MEKQYTNQACSSSSLSGDRPLSPIESAIDRLQGEISEIHCYAGMFINDLGPVLQDERPIASSVEEVCSTKPSSPLAERIEQLADGVRSARMMIIAARDRLTL